ncbi:MAG: hypothetical protein IKU39_07590 [Lachnospiraceae bacterium]|nr:hypothetical protein [Lachnospiraceae bacterium]
MEEKKPEQPKPVEAEEKKVETVKSEIKAEPKKEEKPTVKTEKTVK